MLGGLAVVTGGAALIGAAGLLSVALVSEMDGEDFKNLGIAAVTGTLAGAGAVFIAWTGASALGVAGTLSGAAAITSIITHIERNTNYPIWGKIARTSNNLTPKTRH
jgi:hypothetical protein